MPTTYFLSEGFDSYTGTLLPQLIYHQRLIHEITVVPWLPSIHL